MQAVQAKPAVSTTTLEKKVATREESMAASRAAPNVLSPVLISLYVLLLVLGPRAIMPTKRLIKLLPLLAAAVQVAKLETQIEKVACFLLISICLSHCASCTRQRDRPTANSPSWFSSASSAL